MHACRDSQNHSNDDGWFEVIGEGQVQVVAAIKLPAQGMVPTQMKQAPVHHTTKGDALSRLKKSARESVMYILLTWLNSLVVHASTPCQTVAGSTPGATLFLITTHVVVTQSYSCLIVDNPSAR